MDVEQEEESEESQKVEDPNVDPSAAVASAARPGPDLRMRNRCKTVAYLRKGACPNPACNLDLK